MINRIKQFGGFFLRMRIYLKMEKKKSLGIFKFLATTKYGFLSVSSILYDLSKNNRKRYISDWKRLSKVSKINNFRRVIFDDKLLFHIINKDNEHVQSIIAITQSNRLYVLVSKGVFQELDGIQEFKELVGAFKDGLIIKPSTGGGGARITKVSLINNNLIFNGYCTNFDDFNSRVLKSNTVFLVTEIIKQTGILYDINPDSLNTIRILTMFDPNENKSFIGRAVLRLGTKKSGVVDNFTAGGLSASVDIKTGAIGRGATFPTNSGPLKWYESHPDTGYTFYLKQIPLWNEITKHILAISDEYYYIPYIGWDIVPMDNSFYILEANSNSDLNLLQIHGGLLTDPKIKDFYAHYKIT